MAYGIKKFGREYTKEYSVYITQNEKIISPFHDIPATEDSFKLVNVVNEIPRFTNAKKEINKEEPYNPIKQDVKDNEVRFVKNMFPMKGYLWNYGAIPQTWESTEVPDSRTGIKGDNDPIDAIEIGSKTIATGTVYKAKILGAIAMIDSGECDWKIVVINTEDELFDKINTLEHVEEYKPGLLDATREWFRNYKIADKPGNSGKKNEFANNENYFGAEDAIKIVKETHEHWKALIQEKEHEKISLHNSTQEGTPGWSEEGFLASGPAYSFAEEPACSGAFYFVN